MRQGMCVTNRQVQPAFHIYTLGIKKAEENEAEKSRKEEVGSVSALTFVRRLERAILLFSWFSIYRGKKLDQVQRAQV